MASDDCGKDDLLEDNRTDSGIDSYRSILKSEEPRDPSSDFSGPRDKFSTGEERLDSAYGSSSITVESLSEIVEHCTLSTASEEPAQICELSEHEENLLTTITEEGDTILHLAIIHEDEFIAQELIQLFPKEVLDIQNNLYQSPLHLATYLNLTDMVKGLVEKGANLELQDQDGNTALHVACQHGQTECATEMTRDISSSRLVPVFETQNWRGLACLHLAALNKQHQIMKLLMKKGANLNIQEGTSGKTALHLAVELHDMTSVKLLLGRGANVDAAMFNGCTPLHLAVGRQDTAIANLLFQSGADTMLRNMEDETALDLADGNDDILALFPFDDIQISGRVWQLVLLLFPSTVAAEESSLLDGWHDVWLFRFLINMLGYSTIIIPGYLLISYFKRTNYIETGSGICYPLIKTCVFGSETKTGLLDDVSVTSRNEGDSGSSVRQAVKLVFCAAGLQASYLTWGVLQERVMTRSYGATTTETEGERFKDSQFLVFMNRILALTVSGLWCILFKQPRHGAPMYKYSFASLSNILSSWCQYEALKYISFPTQVLAKASKVIPVMLMGKIVSRKSYEYWEYFTAMLISVGVSMFLLSSTTSKHPSTVTTFSGIVILVGYIVFDSFTSNWQDNLFKYKMSSVQMMFGVNLFSCLFTVGSLLEQGAFFDSLAFMTRHSEFAFHAVLLSVCSACGQLFIFYTINQFGAAVFTIIMTLRQAIAILLSCFLYGHAVTLVGGFGVAVVFLALFLRVYARSRMKSGRRAAQPLAQKV
uniref:Adenosine 3'-phospho 5'-phosphosulfate transporter 1 n=1 Tax=Amphiprion percula TaxID=161767 RepID=A0A3P8SNV7_AMPPE